MAFGRQPSAEADHLTPPTIIFLIPGIDGNGLRAYSELKKCFNDEKKYKIRILTDERLSRVPPKIKAPSTDFADIYTKQILDELPKDSAQACVVVGYSAGVNCAALSARTAALERPKSTIGAFFLDAPVPALTQRHYQPRQVEATRSLIKIVNYVAKLAYEGNERTQLSFNDDEINALSSFDMMTQCTTLLERFSQHVGRKEVKETATAGNAASWFRYQEVLISNLDKLLRLVFTSEAKTNLAAIHVLITGETYNQYKDYKEYKLYEDTEPKSTPSIDDMDFLAEAEKKGEADYSCGWKKYAKELGLKEDHGFHLEYLPDAKHDSILRLERNHETGEKHVTGEAAEVARQLKSFADNIQATHQSRLAAEVVRQQQMLQPHVQANKLHAHQQQQRSLLLTLSTSPPSEKSSPLSTASSTSSTIDSPLTLSDADTDMVPLSRHPFPPRPVSANGRVDDALKTSKSPGYDDSNIRHNGKKARTQKATAGGFGGSSFSLYGAPATSASTTSSNSNSLSLPRFPLRYSNTQEFQSGVETRSRTSAGRNLVLETQLSPNDATPSPTLNRRGTSFAS